MLWITLSLIHIWQVFPGVYVYEMLLFDGEEKYCYIEEQTTGERTEVICARRTEQAKGDVYKRHTYITRDAPERKQ